MAVSQSQLVYLSHANPSRRLRQVEKGMSFASEKRPSPLELYLAALPKEPPAERPRRSSSEGVASNVFYLLFGGALPLFGVLWLMIKYP